MATTLSASAVRTGAIAIISPSAAGSSSLADGNLASITHPTGWGTVWTGPTSLGRFSKTSTACRRPTHQQGRHGGLWECQRLNAVAVAAPETEEVGEDEEEEELGPDSPLVPNAVEIQSLLMELCDETDVAELKLKVGNFKLHVRRSLGKKGSSGTTQAAWAPPPVPSRPMDDPALLAGAPARSATPPQYETDEDVDIDEGLLNETAKKVGIFRRGKLYKGKSGRPIVIEGAVLKVGQVLGYLEQLGTYAPVESEHGGEVVKFLVEDGDPVGYGDELVAVRPSFQGIKKGANLID